MSEKKTKRTISDIRAKAGSKGGLSTSKAKSDAARENGKLGGATGGRPKIPDDQLTPAQRKRRERYENTKKG